VAHRSPRRLTAHLDRPELDRLELVQKLPLLGWADEALSVDQASGGSPVSRIRAGGYA